MPRQHLVILKNHDLHLITEDELWLVASFSIGYKAQRRFLLERKENLKT